jgi:hypothetical protein
MKERKWEGSNRKEKIERVSDPAEKTTTATKATTFQQCDGNDRVNF